MPSSIAAHPIAARASSLLEALKVGLPPKVFAPAEYTFTVVSMEIEDTRSVHEDSDKISFSVAVNDKPAQTVTKDLGNKNNGTFPIGLSVGPVEVTSASDGIAMNYLIVNAGHSSSSSVQSDLDKVGTALAQQGAKTAEQAAGSAIGLSMGSFVFPVIGSILGLIAGWLVGELLGVVFADCDGPVAAEQAAFKGNELWTQTQNPSRSVTHTTYHPGTDSSIGCGSNSRYFVTWEITRAETEEVPEALA
jgi:hypothetical protein